MISLAVLMPVGMALMRLAPRAFAAPVLWVVYTWMGLSFFVVVLLAAGDLARALFFIARERADRW